VKSSFALSGLQRIGSSHASGGLPRGHSAEDGGGCARFDSLPRQLKERRKMASKPIGSIRFGALSSLLLGGNQANTGYLRQARRFRDRPTALAKRRSRRRLRDRTASGSVLLPTANASTSPTSRRRSGSLPARPVGKPEDIAEAYLYLMKTGFSTGETIVVDGRAHCRNSNAPIGGKRGRSPALDRQNPAFCRSIWVWN
jgi:hypothetical protein